MKLHDYCRYMFSYHTVILYTRNPSPSATTSEASGGKLASLAGPPRSAHQHPHARFARHYPPRRSLRSPTAPHARFACPPPTLGLRSQTASDGLSGQIWGHGLRGRTEVAASNGLRSDHPSNWLKSRFLN